MKLNHNRRAALISITEKYQVTNIWMTNECDVKIQFDFDFSLRVRGQHTKTTGRRGRTVGVSKKK